jgi:UDP-N-acetylmuramoylalanine--D-glutamate ligase
MSATDPLPRQVTTLGLGLFGGGAGAARYFAERGVRVVVADTRNEQALAESLDTLKDLRLDYRLGRPHAAEDFAGSELVIVNPGVPPDSPALEMARRAGARLDTEINLLFRLAPAPVAAVTGTNGKSTTVALLGEMLRASGRRTWVGGNLGGSLLPEVDRMSAGDVVVLEISSFQSQRMPWSGVAPRLGAVLNITPNHLDRHADMAEYIAAKKELLRRQGPDDFAVLNGEDPVLRSWADAGAGTKFFFGAPEEAARGFRLDGDTVRLWRPGARAEARLAAMKIPGRHNRFNASAAAVSAWLLGAPPEAIERAACEFTGLPDRIEFVAERNGVRYYNDSIATTPESTLAALEAFECPLLLIAGGSSKNLSFAEVGRRMAARAKAVVLIGRTAGEIETAIRAGGPRPPLLRRAAGLPEAVRLAAGLAQPGDAVALSPACASFDMFRNYAERGRCFRDAVRAL